MVCIRAKAFRHRLARPERVNPLQRVGCAVADQPLNLALLIGAQRSATADRPARAVKVHCHPAAGLVGLHRTSAALVERIHRQRSGVDLVQAS